MSASGPPVAGPSGTGSSGIDGPASTPGLVEVLEEARSHGFLGPGPVDVHVAHALGYAHAVGAAGLGEWWDRLERPLHLLDLGSGGGVPGLVLARHWSRARVTLLDSSSRRTEFLRWAVARIGLSERVRVVTGRAEEVGRDRSERGHYEVVVARSFARPGVTAECAAPFLKVGGLLVVSEPPAGVSLLQPPERAGVEKVEVGNAGSGHAGPRPGRWPERELDELGLVGIGRTAVDFGFQVLRQERACPDRFPRRVGVPSKRPLF